MKLNHYIDPDEWQKDSESLNGELTGIFYKFDHLFHKYSDLLGKAEAQMDKAKQIMSLVAASVEEKKRRYYASEGIKFTEGRLSSDIQLSREYQQAADQYIKAKQIVSEAKSCVDSLRIKKDMILQRSKWEFAEREYQMTLNKLKN